MSDESEWVLIGLDEKIARRQGLPPRLPIPKGEFEGLAENGLVVDKVRAWIKDFLDNSEPGKSGVWRKQNATVVSSLEAFLDKASLWDRAQKAFSENDYEKAISALKRITMMDADDHAARLNIASAYANTGDYANAEKAFKQIRKTFEGDADFHIAVGQLHLAMQKREEAIGEFVLALEAQPDAQGALEALAKLGVLVPIYENPKDASSLLYVRADSVPEYLAGEWDGADHDVDFFLEQLAYHEREMRHAVVILAAERALAKGADGKRAERASLAKAAALRALGDNAEASRVVTDYLAAVPESAAGHVELARCLLADAKKEDSRAAIDKALELDPGDQSALVLRFWPEDSSDLHTVNATIPELSSFAEKHATHAGVWRSLGRAMLIVGRTDEAIDLMKKAVSLAPEDDDLRAEWWTELGKTQRFDEILRDAGSIGDMKTRDWRLRWNEAEAYVGLGKKMEARTLFSAINFDESLHVDIRKRAKRAVGSIDEGEAAPAT
jgi:tetratricopeptide (TPR) repeat protein